MIRHMVALDKRRGIAKDGVQPWRLPVDERYFTDMTKSKGSIVLMGRKTYDVIGKLPDRQNIVLTGDTEFRADGIEVVHELDTLLAAYPDIWVIGGGQLYAATLNRADELYITEIEADYGCDVFYPEYSETFDAKQTGEWQTDNGTRFRFMVYKPKIPQ